MILLILISDKETAVVLNQHPPTTTTWPGETLANSRRHTTGVNSRWPSCLSLLPSQNPPTPHPSCTLTHTLCLSLASLLTGADGGQVQRKSPFCLLTSSGRPFFMSPSLHTAFKVGLEDSPMCWWLNKFLPLFPHLNTSSAFVFQHCELAPSHMPVESPWGLIFFFFVLSYKAPAVWCRPCFWRP